MRTIATLVPAVVIAAFLAHPSVAMPLKVEASIVLAISLVRPAFGLLAIAIVAPLGEIVVPLIGARPIRHADTLVVAFLAGWLGWRSARRGDEPSTTSGALRVAGWVFGCLLVTSVAATGLQLYRVDPERLRGLVADLSLAYLVTDEPFGAHAAGSLLEGIGLLIAAADLSRRQRWLTFWVPACLVASGVIVSAAGGLLTVGIGTAATLSRQLAFGLPRYSAAQPDVNAAGSYLLLLLGVSIGLAAESRRSRALWIAASAALAGGLLLAGSRTAFIAGSVVACGAATAWVARRGALKWIAIALIAAAAAIVVALVRAPAGHAGLGMRFGFTQASLRMIAARPVFGVGEGRYYALSTLALPPPLGWWYGRENAHDYFLQLAAEIGPVGLLAFLGVIASAVMPAMYAVRIGVRPALAGCTAGVLAFLVTCSSGHPLLVPEAAIPFWLVLGLLAGSNAASAVSMKHSTRIGALACAGVLLATVPFRAGPPALRLPPGADGLGPWRADERGTPFRVMSDFASLFVVPSISEIEIPLRTEAAAGSNPVPVNIAVPGDPARQVLVRNEWSTVAVQLAPADPLLSHVRINVAIDPVPGRSTAPAYPPVYVGQPRIVSTRSGSLGR